MDYNKEEYRHGQGQHTTRRKGRQEGPATETLTMADFIKLPRSFIGSPILDNAVTFRLCAWLYANADKNGCISFSSGDALRKFGITPRQFRTIVNLLSATNTATIKTTNKTTNITFCKFDCCECPRQTRRQSKRQTTQPTATNKSSSGTLTISAGAPFVDPMFEEAFSAWLEYKEKQWSFKYKTERSLKSAYQELVRLSGGDPCTAMRIVDQSMSNGWKGLFELKNQHGQAGTDTTNDHANRAESRRRMSALASEIVSRDADIILGLYDGQKQQPDNSIDKE